MTILQFWSQGVKVRGQDGMRKLWSAAVDVTTQHQGAESPRRLLYGSVDEFVRKYLRHTYKRRVNGRNRVWSSRWSEHEEAIARLEALWRAWEAPA